MMTPTKIIKATINDRKYTVTAPIIKEDYGLTLLIEGEGIPQNYEVDFSNNERRGNSVTMIGTADNGVQIPQQFIKTGHDVFAFLYLTGDDYGRTVYKIRIPNLLRPDRTDLQPTPDQADAMSQAIAELNTAKNEWKSMRAEAVTLDPYEDATASYADGVLTLGIPKGIPGEGGGGGGTDLRPATDSTLGGIIVGEDLQITRSGVLSVVKATQVEQDNTHPITSAAVYTEIGNIDALLQTI